MSAAQRAAFERLATMVPRHAVIGTSLNSGAVELYTARAALRPSDWSIEESRAVLGMLQSAGRPFYLLEDNQAQSRLRDALDDDFTVQVIAVLDVPLFGEGAVENPGALWLVRREH
jgi:hypothetical protein